MKILVVEDVDEIFDYYQRFFGKLIPSEGVEIVRASTLEAAAECILEEWDVILMDYLMGDPHTVTRINGAHIQPVHLKNGADLIEFRRKFGKGDFSFILGTSSSKVYNERLVKAGADATHLKNEVEEISKEIVRRM